MKQLKEKNEKKNQKELRKENHHHHHPRAREEGIDIDAITMVPSAYSRGITPKLLKETADKIGMSAQEVNAWLNFMDECGWRFKSDNKVNYVNFRRSLRMWHKIEDKIREERIESDVVRKPESRVLYLKTAALVQKSKNDPSFWALCRESCEHCGEHGCTLGIVIPPDRQVPRPHRPEECSKFDARKEVV